MSVKNDPDLQMIKEVVVVQGKNMVLKWLAFKKYFWEKNNTH
jgi:hypothetical protein